MRTDPGLVVGAAVVRHGRVLAARRAYPAAARGRWELPGGKVEPGETPEAALEREVAEELGCWIRVVGRLTGEHAVSDTLVLRVLLADLVGGEPTPQEHDALRWLGPEELHAVDWLDPDRPFLAELREILLDGTGSRQATSAAPCGSAGPSGPWPRGAGTPPGCWGQRS